MNNRMVAIFFVGVFAFSACGDRGASITLNATVARGERVFTQNCASCHSTIPDTIIVGPSLAGIGEEGSDRVEGLDALAYIEESILDPDAYVLEGFQNVMPKDFGKKLRSDDLDALMAYLMTLRGR